MSVGVHHEYPQALTNVDPHEYRRKMLSQGVVLELVKQGVCSPLNTRGHDKEDLDAQEGRDEACGRPQLGVSMYEGWEERWKVKGV